MGLANPRIAWTLMGKLFVEPRILRLHSANSAYLCGCESIEPWMLAFINDLTPSRMTASHSHSEPYVAFLPLNERNVKPESVTESLLGVLNEKDVKVCLIPDLTPLLSSSFNTSSTAPWILT